MKLNSLGTEVVRIEVKVESIYNTAVLLCDDDRSWSRSGISAAIGFSICRDHPVNLGMVDLIVERSQVDV